MNIGAPAVKPLLEAMKAAPEQPIGHDLEGVCSKNTLLEIISEMRAPGPEAAQQLFDMLEAAGEMKDGDEHHNLRQAIKAALRNIGLQAPQVADFLRPKLKSPLLSVRYSSALTLVHMRQDVDEALPLLLEVLRSPELKFLAQGDVRHLLDFSDAELPQLSEWLSDKDPWIRRSTLGAYGSAAYFKRGAREIPKIIELLRDSDSSVQYTAVRALGDYEKLAIDAVNPLRQMLKSDAEAFLRIGVIQAFEKLGKFAPGIEADLVEVLKGAHFEAVKVPADVPANQLKIPQESGFDHTDEVRKACVATLFALKPAGPQALKHLLRAEDANARRIGAWAMGELKNHGKYALAELQELTNDPDLQVQAAAMNSISIIDPQLHAELKRGKTVPASPPPATPADPPAEPDF
jgi:HEAT repeat protein